MSEAVIDLVHHGAAERWGGWEWRKPRRGDHFRTCSYCGSIHPEDLAAQLVAQGPCATCGLTGWSACFEAQGIVPVTERQPHSYDPGGAYASWADQKYGWPHKFYVERLMAKNQKMLHCRGHAHGPDAWQPGGAGLWVAAEDLTRGQKRIIAADGMGPRKGEKHVGWYLFQPKESLFAKFYTIHLADPGISDEVKDKICAASGIRFHFDGEGHVAWHGAAFPCEEVHPG